MEQKPQPCNMWWPNHVLDTQNNKMITDRHNQDHRCIPHGIYHQACEMDIEAFEEEVESLKKVGAFHQIIERPSGRTAYFWDPEGNYKEMHASRSQS